MFNLVHRVCYYNTHVGHKSETYFAINKKTNCRKKFLFVMRPDKPLSLHFDDKKRK